MSQKFLYIIGIVLLLCIGTLVAFGNGENPPNSTRTVDKNVGYHKIESEPDRDYRFIVTTSVVTVLRDGRGRQSLPFSRGANNVRNYLDTLAKEHPDGFVVVHGVFDLVK